MIPPPWEDGGGAAGASTGGSGQAKPTARMGPTSCSPRINTHSEPDIAATTYKFQFQFRFQHEEKELGENRVRFWATCLIGLRPCLKWVIGLFSFKSGSRWTKRLASPVAYIELQVARWAFFRKAVERGFLGFPRSQVGMESSWK